MQVNELKSTELEKEFEVIIPASEINLLVQERMNDLSKKISLPGFRPGKVPMSMLKNKYETSVFGEVAEEKLKSVISSIVTERNFDLLETPDIQNFDGKPGQDIKFSLFLSLRPKFDLPNFSDFEVEQVSVLVSQEDVVSTQNYLRGFKSQEVVVEDKKYKASEGDIVVIDFKGFKDDVPFEGGEAQDFSLTLGSKSMIPGFEEQIIGKKLGEAFDMMVTFPEEYHSKDLAGKETKFEIKIKKISKKTLPEWNEDLAKELNHNTLDELNAFVTKMTKQKYAESVNLLTKIRLFNKIDEVVNFTLPTKMIESELKTLVSQLSDAGEKIDDQKESDSYRKVAERRVKIGLILAEYARAKNIQVEERDLQNAIFNQSRSAGLDKNGLDSMMNFYRNNQQALMSLRDSLLEDKAVHNIISNDIKIKTVDIEASALEALIESEADTAIL